jgi:hypothetical protein
MRKTFGWHKKRDRISMSQLEKLTGCQEKSIAIAIKSLIKKGLISKSVTGSKGVQSTHYAAIVHEDSNNYDPPQFAGGTPRNLRDTKETLPKERKQQQKEEQATPVAAVSFEKDGKEKNTEKKKKEPEKPTPYECLSAYDDTALPMKEKIWITSHHKEETVKNAILWANSETKPFKKGLAAALKWACTESPEIAKNKADIKEENKAYALRYDGIQSDGIKIETLNTCVNFEWSCPCATPCFSLHYDDNGFRHKFNEKLKQRKIPILE